VLSHFDIDQLRRLAARGQAPPSSFRFTGIELGAALELAAATVENDSLCATLDEWSQKDERLAGARRAFAGVSTDAELFSAPTLEFAALRNRVDLEQMTARFFNRFARSLSAHGFEHLSVGIAKALFDMADNVIQHSGIDVDHAALGAIAYEVGDRRCAFAVADIGRGVLASLVTNPDWTHLTSPSEALDATVRRGASRRAGQGPGHGFSDLHRALADLLGTLRFSTGDAVLKLEGQPNHRVVSTAERLQMMGMQISISFSLQ
jgi:hypothetical protein